MVGFPPHHRFPPIGTRRGPDFPVSGASSLPIAKKGATEPSPPQTAAFRQNRLINRLIKQRSRQTRFAPFAAARDINRKPDG